MDSDARKLWAETEATTDFDKFIQELVTLDHAYVQSDCALHGV
jgi:hypothetical protein